MRGLVDLGSGGNVSKTSPKMVRHRSLTSIRSSSADTEAIDAEVIDTEETDLSTDPGIDFALRTHDDPVEDDGEIIGRLLNKVLAQTYCLAMKTHNYHWNVRGPHFFSLHAAFEAQYKDLYQASDLIAERHRALGELIPANFALFQREGGACYLTEERDMSLSHALPVNAATLMVTDLVKSHEAAIEGLDQLRKAARDGIDAPTEDMAIERLRVHQKTVWMLKSTCLEMFKS